MTATREAFVLPGIFLTVGLLGGLRIAGTVRLVPPPLAALVLGMLLLASLTRASVLSLDRLMNTDRSPLENASGAVVLASLFAASAQVFNLLTPDRGLLHAVFSAFFVIQLLTTLAGAADRRILLRSLFVLLGSAFVLRFIILESLYAPDSGLTKRVVTALLEGVSLGTLDYAPHAAATGYVAFLTLVLYMAGLTLLRAPAPSDQSMRAIRRMPGTDVLIVLAAVALASTACGGGRRHGPSRTDTTPEHADSATVEHAARLREEALRTARVWRAPATPIAQIDFSANPSGPGLVRSTDDVSCRFVPQTVGGTTPKFDCQLSDGEIVKVKYGGRNPEPRSEVAATRLLAALGFGSDRMYVVRRIHCAGCPIFPFQALRCLARTGFERLCLWGIDDNRTIDFETAVLERRSEGRVIEAGKSSGWAWYELERIDPARGGAARAEVDALRLLAVFLAHWDNKAENQRLICLPGGDLPDGGCRTPVAIVQDLGATFGPLKVDLRNWRETAIWADRSTCTVSMMSLPFEGGTFPDWRISEPGRRLLLGLLEQVSEHQLRDLFSASRITTYDQINAEGRSPEAWVTVFQNKVRQIREARCS